MAAPASAKSVVYGACGPSLCRVDAATGKKTILLKATAAKPYAAVGASRTGGRLAWIRDEEVFRAGRGGAKPKRVGTALRQAAPEVNVRPDGGAVEWIDVLQRPDLITGGVYYERNLLVDAKIVATDMQSAGWLGREVLRQAFGENGAPWFICVVTAQDGCVRSVAVDPDRSLDDPAGSPDGKRVAAVAREPGADAVTGPIALYDAKTGRRIRDLTTGADLDPAFSPDGKRVAFVRGRDLWTVPVAGGKARRLARDVASPAWSAR